MFLFTPIQTLGDSDFSLLVKEDGGLGLCLGFTACCLCPLQLTVMTARDGHPLGWLALCRSSVTLCASCQFVPSEGSRLEVTGLLGFGGEVVWLGIAMSHWAVLL